MDSGQQPRPHGEPDLDIRKMIAQNILTPIPPLKLPKPGEALNREERLKTIIQNREKMITQVKAQIVSSALSEPENLNPPTVRNPPREVSEKSSEELLLKIKDPAMSRQAQRAPKKPGSTYANPIPIDQVAPLSQPVKVAKALEVLTDSPLARQEQEKWEGACVRMGIPYPGREERRGSAIRMQTYGIGGSPSGSVAASPTGHNAAGFGGSPLVGGLINAASPLNSGSPINAGSPMITDSSMVGSPIEQQASFLRDVTAGEATKDPRRTARNSLENIFARPGMVAPQSLDSSLSDRAPSQQTSRRESLNSGAPVGAPIEWPKDPRLQLK